MVSRYARRRHVGLSAHIAAVSLLSFPMAAVNGQVFGTPSKAEVTVAVQPEQDGELVFGHAAPSNVGEPDAAKLVINLRVTNVGGSPVKLDRVIVSFFGPPAVFPLVYQFDAQINAGKTKSFFLQKPENAISSDAQFIKLPYPTPWGTKIELKFDGYSTPTALIRVLKRHENTTNVGSYLFWGKKADLAQGEFWSASSSFTTGHHGGNQAYAHDIGLRRWDDGEDEWTQFKAISNQTGPALGDENADYLVWNRPVYAMADGEVYECEDGYPDDPANGDAGPPPGGGTIPGGGNHFWIRHGTEYVLFAHMKANTLNKAICFAGAQVKKGDYLGRVGNSGSSGAPHLHIHVVELTNGGHPKDNVSRPLHLRGARTVDYDSANGNNPGAAPWVTLDENILPLSPAGSPPVGRKHLIDPLD